MKELGVSISSIYLHLKQLEEKGFIEIQEKSEIKGGKCLYKITEKGRNLLTLMK